MNLYQIKNASGETIYIGVTSRKLSLRISEHKSVGRVPVDSSIHLIRVIPNINDALSAERSLINLIGLKRLVNKVSDTRYVNKGLAMSNETRLKISLAQKGIPKQGTKWTKERRDRTIASLTGIKKNKEKMIEARDKMGFKRFDLFLDDRYIGQFNNQTWAAEAIGFKKSTFVDILKGKRKNNKGVRVVYNA